MTKQRINKILQILENQQKIVKRDMSIFFALNFKDRLFTYRGIRVRPDDNKQTNIFANERTKVRNMILLTAKIKYALNNDLPDNDDFGLYTAINIENVTDVQALELMRRDSIDYADYTALVGTINEREPTVRDDGEMIENLPIGMDFFESEIEKITKE